MPRRWDGDTQGHGVGDASRLALDAEELVAAFTEAAWVAEQPELHLLPHIEAWCRADQRLLLTSASGDDQGAYVLELQWQGPSGGVGQARAAAFALIGAFAESATFVRQRRVDATLQFQVGTGEMPDAQFDPHGHVVVLNVAGVL